MSSNLPFVIVIISCKILVLSGSILSLFCSKFSKLFQPEKSGYIVSPSCVPNNSAYTQPNAQISFFGPIYFTILKCSSGDVIIPVVFNGESLKFSSSYGLIVPKSAIFTRKSFFSKIFDDFISR